MLGFLYHVYLALSVMKIAQFSIDHLISINLPCMQNCQSMGILCHQQHLIMYYQDTQYCRSQCIK